MLLRGHARCDFAQLRKIQDPEYFIDIQVAVMALRGVGWCAKNQLCAIVAIIIGSPVRSAINQSRKRMMYSGARKPTFYWLTKISGYGRFERAQRCLAGKIERRANLAGFENVTNTVRQPCAVTTATGTRRLVENNSSNFSIASSLKKFFFGFCALTLLVGDVGVQVGLVAGLAQQRLTRASRSICRPSRSISLKSPPVFCGLAMS